MSNRYQEKDLATEIEEQAIEEQRIEDERADAYIHPDDNNPDKE